MFSWLAPSDRTLVVAHRGASASTPENTLAAFSRALDDGADAFELDARLTADGRVVVFHDTRLGRTTGSRGKVSETSASAIRALSAGAWFSEEFAGDRVPFLEEALELAGTTAGVNVELKFDSRREDPRPLVRAVCGIVRDLRRAESVLVSSFHHGALDLQRSLAPEISTGILVYPPGVPSASGVRRAVRTGAGWLVYSGGNIRKSFVTRAAEAGVLAMEYTVNTPARARRALAFGVAAVITDDPAGIRRAIGGRSV